MPKKVEPRPHYKCFWRVRTSQNFPFVWALCRCRGCKRQLQGAAAIEYALNGTDYKKLPLEIPEKTDAELFDEDLT